MHLRIWDVEHGACAMLQHHHAGTWGPLAMIDSGCTDEWRPSEFITKTLLRDRLEYLFVTNADQDHIKDLKGLWDAQINVGNFYFNPSYSGAQYTAIKQQVAPLLTDDARLYAALCDCPPAAPHTAFDLNMRGIRMHRYWPNYPHFKKTNDLSMAVFFEYGGFRVLFPGDLEEPGWRALLTLPDFRNHLANTTVLVASHHGRKNGYLSEVFDHCRPRAVVMSDKGIAHESQETGDWYRDHVFENFPEGVLVANTGKRRYLLTTRCDGYIHFTVMPNGDFRIDTESTG
jgi:hypothetical protein